MINQSLDFYDDLEGHTLKAKVSDFTKLPDFIKTAEQLSPEIRDTLPDDVYALVMLDGGRKMRKYACTDKGNTALSVIYFLENSHKLTIEAQKTAAVNLVTACQWYDMEPPEQLTKIALIGAAMNVLGAVDAAKTGKENLAKMKAKHGQSGMASEMEPMKVSELTGTDPMPYSPERMKKASAHEVDVSMGPIYDSLRKANPHHNLDEKAYSAMLKREMADDPSIKWDYKGIGHMLHDQYGSSEKRASLHPHVDVTGKRAPTRVVHEEPAKFFCLIKEGGARYPIDTAIQVEKAAEYFVNYGQRFTPFERHRYCTNLTKRAEALGMRMPDVIRKYGSASYAPDVQVAIARRRQYFHAGATEHGLLTEMMQKCAAIVPETFAVMLEQFDRNTGLADRWGNGIDDPYFSVFGFVKQANWSFTYSNDHISEDQLKKLSRDVIRREEIKRRFGCDFAEDFEKNPVQIFDSLPLEHKRIIMHMASGVEE